MRDLTDMPDKLVRALDFLKIGNAQLKELRSEVSDPELQMQVMLLNRQVNFALGAFEGTNDGWTSVEKELPRENVRVLFFVKDWGVTVGCYSKTYGWRDSSVRDFRPGDVTDWRPMVNGPGGLQGIWQGREGI